MLQVLLSTALLLCLTSNVSGVKIYKSRSEILALLGESEGRLYISSCIQSSRADTCSFASDNVFIQEPTQCALTNLEALPWWKATLENPSYVTKVTVLNMDKTYRSQPDGLRNMEVSAGGDICFRYESNESFVKRSFPCDSFTDQVTIRSNILSAVLALCDVQVFGVPIKFRDILSDPSVLKVRSCEQSSVDGNGYCENAFDGDANNNHLVKPCAVTVAEERPLLRANLETPSQVFEIRLYNRGDCCSEGLSSFTMSLNTWVCARYEGRFSSMAIPCKYFGNSILIVSGLHVAMSICEMQIVGHVALLADPPKFRPLGCYKDDFKNRDLTQLVSSITMSHEKCYKMCKRLNLKFFGVQNGRFCWCGASYGKLGKLDDNKCSVPCEDNEKQMCGGAIYNNVFEIL